MIAFGSTQDSRAIMIMASAPPGRRGPSRHRFRGEFRALGGLPIRTTTQTEDTLVIKRLREQLTGRTSPVRLEERPVVPPDIPAELHRLKHRLPSLIGSMVATADGLVLTHDLDSVEPGGLAALTAAALGVAARLTETTGAGPFHELLTRGQHGYVATYAAGSAFVLTLVAGPDTNVGLLHFEARQAAERIAQHARAAVRGPRQP